MDKLNFSVYEISDSIENLIAEGAVVPIYISGSSMNPFLISRRDIVYLRLHTEKDFKKGSILLFKRGDGSLVIHRVKKICSDGSLLICGDAQTECENIGISQVVAVVTEIERKGIRRSADSLYWKTVNILWQILFPARSLLMRIWFKVRRIRNKK